MDSFFGIGLPELILILLVAGIVMGPERIGVAARWLGRTTSQLQAVSRSFVRQINAELDGLEGSEDVKETMREMQDLQSELSQLKQELLSLTGNPVQEAKRAASETAAELERRIAPDNLLKGDNGSGATLDDIPDVPQELPKRVAVEDDPDR